MKLAPLLALLAMPAATLVGLALLTTLLLVRGHRLWRASRRENALPVPTPAALARRTRPLADAPPDVVRWQVEMHELAREISARIDSKLVLCQQLLIQTDERIARLELLLAQVHGDEESAPSRRAG